MRNRFALLNQNPVQSNKPSLNIKQKLIAWGISILTASGIGTGIGVNIYWMLTTAVAKAGMGIVFAGLAAKIAILGASGLSLLIAIPIAYLQYKDYVNTA